MSSSISRSMSSSSSSSSSKQQQQPKTTTDDDTDDDIKSTMSSSSSYISRSLSLPPPPPLLPNFKFPPSNYLIDQMDDDIKSTMSSSSSISRSLSLPPPPPLIPKFLFPPSNYLIDEMDDDTAQPGNNVVITMSSSSTSICRSRSLPRYLKRETCQVEDLLLTRLPPSNYLIDEMDGNVAIKRFFHDHPLTLSTYLKENVDRCRICKIYLTWGTPVYKCIGSECGDMIFHKLCAELPRRITNLLHPEHPLEYTKKYDEREAVRKCGYQCFVCTYNRIFLDVKCAFQDVPISVVTSSSSSSSSLSRSLSFPLYRKQNSPIPRNLPTNVSSLLISSFPKFQIQKKADQIRHISHKKHPLFLMTYFQQFEKFRSFDCIICDAEFLPDDLVYGCHECNFFLHKSCAEIVYPLTMRNTSHSAHHLELTFLAENTTATCIICDKDLSGRIGYNCALCQYVLGIECAFENIFEDHTKHKFIVILKELIFTCDACGVTENKERHSSVCTGCRLQVHKKCTNLFPPTVKQRQHPHTLHLTYFFECGDDFADMMCKICFNKINNVYCMYQCTKCTTYITHVTCSTSIDILEIEETDQIMPSSVESTEEEGRQVKHFSHPDHDLIYSNVKTETDAIICDACVMPISCVPFYKCADNRCSFCLHKQCFDLPRELQHPLHAHRLALTVPYEKRQYFEYCLFCVQCYGCDIRCNGFVYGCEKCNFWMDVRCSSLSYTLEHDSHACTLSLVDYNRVRDQGIVDKAKCSACDCKCELHSLCKYTCERCNFHLDLGCSLLPKTVAHDCPRHNWKQNYPLKLMYGAIKNASGLYFCDICEEPRGENDWFYYCEDCKWSNHPQCVLGKVQLKYGKIYEFLRCHFTLVKISERLPKYFKYSCDKCEKPCKDSVFYSTTGGTILHPECASSDGVCEIEDDMHLVVRAFLNGIQEIQSEDDNKRLTVHAFLNGIQEIQSEEDDSIRLVRAFLNEIREIESDDDYNVRRAVRVCLVGVRNILIEGDDDILGVVHAFFNEFREMQSEGDHDILVDVRKFFIRFRELMSEYDDWWSSYDG